MIWMEDSLDPATLEILILGVVVGGRMSNGVYQAGFYSH